MRGVSTGRKVSCRPRAEYSSARTVRNLPGPTKLFNRDFLSKRKLGRRCLKPYGSLGYFELCLAEPSRLVSILTFSYTNLPAFTSRSYLQQKSHMLYSWPFEVPSPIHCWSHLANTPSRARSNGRADFKIPDQMSLIE